jgi:hypothetical protein
MGRFAADSSTDYTPAAFPRPDFRRRELDAVVRRLDED